MTKPTHFLLIGATGGFGGAILNNLLSRPPNTIHIKILARSPAKLKKHLPNPIPNVEIIQGDVQDAEVLNRAVEGCEVVLFGVNYPYDQWTSYMRPALQNTLTACKNTFPNARLIFPGNVYNYKPIYSTPLSESHPQEPVSHKGHLRKELEHMLRDSGLPVLIIRANDYFGPTARNVLLEWVFGNAIRQKRQQLMGTMFDVIRQMVYLPDLARATVDVLLSPHIRLPVFETFHYGGYTLTKREFCSIVWEEAQKINGTPSDKIRGRCPRGLPWFMVSLVGRFDSQAKEVVEMRYLHDNDLRLSDDKLMAVRKGFVGTEVRQAIRVTLESYKTELEAGE